MCSASDLVARALLAVVLGAAASACAEAASAPPRPALRVCADPNNLPFSNRAGQGFENALAELIATDLGRTVEYTWWPQRRGFIRSTLKAGRCDLVPGVPASFELAATTAPYYRSAYAFVTRADRDLALTSLDDPRLRALRVGVHVIGDDYASVPPAAALARRGVIGNLVGFSIYGDYSQPDPPLDLIRAVERGEIDVAIAWGPLAGHGARRAAVPLHVQPIASDEPGMSFAIAMATRRGDPLRARVEAVLARRAPDIARLLDRHGVPRLALEEPR